MCGRQCPSGIYAQAWLFKHVDIFLILAGDVRAGATVVGTSRDRLIPYIFRFLAKKYIYLGFLINFVNVQQTLKRIYLRYCYVFTYAKGTVLFQTNPNIVGVTTVFVA